MMSQYQRVWRELGWTAGNCLRRWTPRALQIQGFTDLDRPLGRGRQLVIDTTGVDDQDLAR